MSPIIFYPDLELDPLLMETKIGIIYIFSSLECVFLVLHLLLFLLLNLFLLLLLKNKIVHLDVFELLFILVLVLLIE